MRKLILCAFLFCGFSLSAQTYREARIFIQPVIGTGIPGDNAYFFKQLNYEVSLQRHSLVKAFRDSDFVLRGTIVTSQNSSQTVFRGTVRNDNTMVIESVNIPKESVFNYEGYEEGACIFDLVLLNAKTDAVMARQYMQYKSLGNLDELVSILVYNVLSGVLDVRADYWRDKWLFVSADIMWTPRIYDGTERSAHIFNIGLGLSAEYHFLNFLSAEIGLDFAQDWINLSAVDGDYYRDLMLEIPVSLKYVFKPKESFVLGVYGGGQLNFSLMGATNPSILSVLGGVQFGVKAGPGIVTIDGRVAWDILKSNIDDRLQDYRRTIIRTGVGYKYGFYNRPETPIKK